MTRIATAISSQIALNELLRNQRDLISAQSEVASGKKATDLKGLGSQLGTLSAARALAARNDGYLAAARETSSRLAAQDLALGEVAGAADDLRQAVTDAIALDSGTTLMQRLGAAFDRALGGLNTKFAGRALFGGSKVDSPPVNISTLDALGSAASAASIFTNTKVKATAQIDNGPPVTVGFLADDIGTGLMSAIKSIKDYNDSASGPFGAKLTAAQKSFLQSTLAGIISASEALNTQLASNGLLQNRVEQAQKRGEDQKLLLTNVIGGIEDADIATAATHLQQAQTAVEASARTFSLLRNLSLLNFLR